MDDWQWKYPLKFGFDLTKIGRLAAIFHFGYNVLHMDRMQNGAGSIRRRHLANVDKNKLQQILCDFGLQRRYTFYRGLSNLRYIRDG